MFWTLEPQVANWGSYGAVAQVVSSRQSEKLEIVVQLHAAPLKSVYSKILF